MTVELRNETENDHFEVENLTREAFWDIYKPGCEEHLVLHRIRRSEGFVKELDMVAVYDGKIIGNIVYSKGYIVSEGAQRTECITFGPLSVLPEFQHRGIGSLLVSESLKRAAALGYRAVLITGSPRYYSRFGFVPASKYGIYLDDGIPEDGAPFFMAKELYPGALEGLSGRYEMDKCYQVDSKEVEEFDKRFPPKIKKDRERRKSPGHGG